MKYFIAIIVFGILKSTVAEIAFKNNGYEGIQIVIENGTPENPDLIRKIKDMFESGSEFMHHATRNLSYFRQASVVIPKDWNISSTFNVKTIFNEIPYDSADIRVGKENEYYKNTPYTLQPGGCFEPGTYIHFTPEYLLDKGGEMQELYGDPGRQLVHEWAHLRYGVFDEYGITGSRQFPPFYASGDDFTPTSCNKNVVGFLESIDGQKCYVDNKSRLPIDCLFIPDIDSNTISSSIMYLPNIPSITEFCDDSNKLQHNFEAPSQQNILCNYLPSWNVISSHPDFGNMHSMNVTKREDFKLSILQPNKEATGRYVIVGDHSGSMSDPCIDTGAEKLDRIDCINTALKRFIEMSIPDGSYLGIVEFNGNSRILNGMTKIDNYSRLQLSTRKFSIASGGTNINAGLMEGIQLLKRGNKTAEGGVLILLSDGLDNELQNHVDEIVKYKVVINSVAIGEDASIIMTDFVKRTGGKMFFLSNKQKDLTKLDQAFKNSIIHTKEEESIQVSVKSISTTKTITRSKVIIDSSLGKKTKFQFSSLSTSFAKTNIKLTSPNGTTFTENDSVFKYLKDIKMKIFSINKAEPGEWEFEINCTQVMSVSFTLSSMKADSSAVPITSKCWLDNVKINLEEKSFVRVFCQVSKGYDAVIRANVTAYIQAENGSVFRYQLYDDGSGADIIEEDGIYSTYFLDFVSDNRYSVSVEVTSLDETRVLLGTRASSAPIIRKVNKTTKAKSKFPISDFLISPSEKKPIEEKLAEKFQRFVTANSFLVSNYNKFKSGNVAPSKVTDFKVVESRKSEDNVANVELQWTSSGNHLDIGTAKEVVIYYSDKFENLRKEVNLTAIKDYQVINGSLKNLLRPHDIQTIELEIDNVTAINLFFSMKTLNSENKLSSLSNIVQAYFIELAVGYYNNTGSLDTTTYIYETSELPEERTSISNDSAEATEPFASKSETIVTEAVTTSMTSLNETGGSSDDGNKLTTIKLPDNNTANTSTDTESTTGGANTSDSPEKTIWSSNNITETTYQSVKTSAKPLGMKPKPTPAPQNSKMSKTNIIVISCVVVGIVAIIIAVFIMTKIRHRRKLKINDMQMK